MHEMPGKEGDQESQGGHLKERTASHTGGLPRLWHQGISHRQEVDHCGLREASGQPEITLGVAQVMGQGIWILEECADERFPYRLQIIKEQEPRLVLRMQDRWPAAGRNIFCLRDNEPPRQGEMLKEIERIPIVAFHERGRRVEVILDRRRSKRCDFLFLARWYKRHPRQSYEQIFWLTQRSIEQHSSCA